MKQVTLNIRENRYSFFMQLVQALDFVQIADEQHDANPGDSYNPDFVAKIKQSQQEFKDGNFTSVQKEDLKEFLGL
ncbi:DUF2683 family protein [Persicitalea jodogahamensis]|uniref:Uncharacterized protein n=1 Tax=Persicitalea jodogahamensis TaxID=402147 RepID=A0A8J3D772_9BACT|nr:DUF2683 family protein [Persicitalea jodogahamensis]GHB71087.1 hypothetical protein GCM10007390_26070 [Persicitalea jodogahamensis]